jgi:cysteine-rich repeat protein
LPQQHPIFSNRYIVKECNPCGISINNIQPHPLLQLSTDKLRCSGICGDGIRLTYNKFNLNGLPEEECDDGN